MLYGGILEQLPTQNHGVFTPFVLRSPLRSGVGEDDLQRLIARGIAKGLIGAHDISEHEAVGDELLGQELAGHDGLEQELCGDGIDEPGGDGDVL